MIPGTKMTNTGPFWWNGSSKIQIFTDFSTFSVGGRGGQLMLFFWKLIRETQISKPPEATRHHNSTKLLILVPLRANLLCTLHYETPCILMTKYINLIHKNYCLLLFPQIILIKGFQKKPKKTIYSAEKEKSAVLIFSHWYFSISPIQWKYKHSFYVS